MSVSLEQDVRCPCGEEFGASLWSAVNCQTEPDLREALLSGQLNVVPCPRCGQMVYAERFVLYHDSANELLAFVYPTGYETEAAKWEHKTSSDFETAQKALEPDKRLRYPAITIFGMDALVTLIQNEQEAEDQGAIVESLVDEAKIRVCKLDRLVARRNHLPRVIPFGQEGKSAEDRLQAGLRSVLQANDRLSVYSALLERLKKNPGKIFEAVGDIETGKNGKARTSHH